MRFGVIGVGHAGLVTAALAELGHEVVSMDLDVAKIELPRAGKAPFFETLTDRGDPAVPTG
jgi:UDPglucose 6-dehydrogenase